MVKYVFLLAVFFLLIPQIYYLIKNKQYKNLNNGTKFFVKSENLLVNNRRKVILTNTDGFDIYTNIFDVENPKAVIQIIHGVYEHSGNYWQLADYLMKNGYAVIISDNRGHGKSVSEKYPSGYIKYVDEIVDDQHVINQYMRLRYPNNKYYMIGHSFGSMIARLYLQEHDDTIDKLVLTGTVSFIPIAFLGVIIGNILTFYLGEYRKSIIMDALTGVASPDLNWISYNKENIEAKQKDPLRLKGFLARANVVLISANKRLHDFSKFNLKNKSLPIISLTGVEDKVVGGEKGLYNSTSSLEKIGYENVKWIVYENMKHEVLCENDKELVFEDIIEFFEDKNN